MVRLQEGSLKMLILIVAWAVLKAILRLFLRVSYTGHMAVSRFSAVCGRFLDDGGGQSMNPYVAHELSICGYDVHFSNTGISLAATRKLKQQKWTIC